MTNAFGWFTRTDSEIDPNRSDEEPSESTLEAFDLPPHVQEFLALKERAGV
jgi:hypothetical protein